LAEFFIVVNKENLEHSNFLPLWIEALSVHQHLMRVMILWFSLTNLNIIATIMNSRTLNYKVEDVPGLHLVLIPLRNVI
jgi:hypothetical protein